MAVGSYWNAVGNQVGLLETESSGGFIGQDVVLSSSMIGSSGNSLASVSCLASGDCMAVGVFADPTVGNAMVVNLRSGGWQPAVPAPRPAVATRKAPSSALDSVSCSSGSCTAVGGYNDPASGEQQPLVVVEVDGSLQAISVPPGLAGPTPGSASSVSCAGPGECAAVGTAGQTRPTACCETVGSGLLLGQSSGLWTQATAMMPADAASPAAANDTFFPLPVLNSVSCPPGGGCVGGGTYEPAGGIKQFSHANAPLLINRSGSAWGSGFAPGLPTDAASGPPQTSAGLSDPTDVIDAVSCATAGTCVAVGSYTDASGNTEPLLVTSTPGSAPSSLAVHAPSAASSGSPIAGSSVNATLSSHAGPTGAISFRVFGPSTAPPTNCSSGGTQAGTARVSGVGSYNPSATFTPASPGAYWWYAAYSGDDNAQQSTSACGPGMSEMVAAHAGVRPTKPVVCSKPTGRLTATAIGPIALGIKRTIANRRLTHHTGTTTTERFCMRGGGATHVLYASRRLLAGLPASARRKLIGRVVVVLTDSPHYAIRKVKIGTAQKTAIRALKLTLAHRVGKTIWYLSRVRGGERVIKVQGAKVTELGVVNPVVLAEAGWRAVLRGF